MDVMLCYIMADMWSNILRYNEFCLQYKFSTWQDCSLGCWRMEAPIRIHVQSPSKGLGDEIPRIW